MIEMTAGAQSRLNDYLAELRRVLQECPSVDPGDVERDVHDHIEAALAGAQAPVDESHLDRVLRSLGVPRDWVPDAGRPWYEYPQRVGRDLRELTSAFLGQIVSGPESFRLPYLSLGMAFLTPLLVYSASSDDEAAILIACLGSTVTFVLARAAVALHAERPPTAQLWVLAPALLAIYVPLAVTLFVWPAVAGGIATVLIADHETRAADFRQRVDEGAMRLANLEEEYDATTDVQEIFRLREVRKKLKEQLENDERLASRHGALIPPAWLRQVPPIWLAVFATAALTGLWWLLAGLTAWRRPGWVRAVFRPFADNYRGRGGLWLSAAGVALLGVGLAYCFG